MVTALGRVSISVTIRESEQEELEEEGNMNPLKSASWRIHRSAISASVVMVGLLLPTAGLSQGAGGPMKVGTCQRDITPVSPSLAPAYESTFGLAATVNHNDPVYLAGFGNNQSGLRVQ